MTGRVNMKSRAREVEFMLGLLEKPEVLLDRMTKNGSGGVSTCEGIRFEYGKIKTLVKHIKIDDLQTIQSSHQKFRPLYVFHLDGISKKRKIAIEVQHKLKQKTLNSGKQKADLLLIGNAKQVSFISYKDSKTSTKLGQVSKAEYGKARLEGGLMRIVLPDVEFPDEILRSHTGLNAKQWKSIAKSSQEKKYAYVKKRFPKLWNKIVRDEMKVAYSQLEEFGKVIKKDRNSLIKFVEMTLIGPFADGNNFYIVFGDEFISVTRVLQELKKPKVKVTTELRKTTSKKSLLIFIAVNGKKYCLTKIEPSFEGSAKDVIQTKGVIFHFQQYPLKNAAKDRGLGSFKDLLQDISE